MIEILTTILSQAVVYQGIYLVLEEARAGAIGNFIKALAVFLTAVMLYAFRKWIKSLPLFFVAHIAVMFLSFKARGLLATIMLGMAILSMIRRFVVRREQPENYHLILLGILYFATLAGKLPTARVWVYWGFILLVLCRILYNNSRSVEQFIQFRHNTTSMDEKKLRFVSMGITAFYTLLVGAVLLFAGIFPLDRMAIALWAALKKGLIGFLRFLAGFGPEEGEGPEPPEEMAMGQGGGMMPMEASEPGVFAQIMNIVFIVLAYALVIALALGLITALILFIYRRFYQIQTVEADEERTFLSPITISLRRDRKTVEEPVSDRSIRRRIRALYKKNMRFFWRKDASIRRRRFLKGNDAPIHLTPAEQLRESEYAPGDEIREIYERARYSTKSVSSEDYSRLKDLFLQ